jgi:6-phosphogluconate dehydrogenase (decarboxylating)
VQIAMVGLLHSRFAPGGSEMFADEAESARRLEFGGHVEKAAAENAPVEEVQT